VSRLSYSASRSLSFEAREAAEREARGPCFKECGTKPKPRLPARRVEFWGASAADNGGRSHLRSLTVKRIATICHSVVYLAASHDLGGVGASHMVIGQFCVASQALDASGRRCLQRQLTAAAGVGAGSPTRTQ
jgi:hypothetical protein